MKLQKSLPQNAAFFERYADLIHSLTKAASIAQVFTALCEIGILTALFTKGLSDFLPPQYVGALSLSCGVLFAFGLQIALRQLFPMSVRAILNRLFHGLDLPMSIGIFIGTAALLSLSVWLSWQGSKDIADVAIKPVTEKTTEKQDSDKAAAMATAQRLFTSDSATIETKYTGKHEAIESEYLNIIQGIERGGKRATTLRAELKTKLAKLQADKATELEAKATDRKAAMDKAETRHDNETATINSDNREAKTKTDEKRTRYGGYIGYFTAFCYLFFLVVFALNEIYHKGASIETKPIPHQRHFSQSVWKEFLETVKEKIDIWFRSKIQSWSDRTPPPPLPMAQNVLYDFKTDVLTDTLKVETTAKQMKVVKLPLKAPGIAAEKTDETGPVTTTDPPRKIGFLNTSEAIKVQGGKRSDDAVNTANVNTANLGSDKTRVCLHCGTSYIYSIHNQKYCSETCRVAAYELRTGRKLKKQPKKVE